VVATGKSMALGSSRRRDFHFSGYRDFGRVSRLMGKVRPTVDSRLQSGPSIASQSTRPLLPIRDRLPLPTRPY
jgi:hypothetical protein